MLITCQNCNTQFIVDPMQIGANGRKVKCSKCQTIWYQQQITSEEITNKDESTEPNNLNSESLEKIIPESKHSINDSLDNNSSTIYEKIGHGINLPVKINAKANSYLPWQQFFLHFFTLSLIIFNASLVYFLFNYNTYLKKDSLFDFIHVNQIDYFKDHNNNKFTIKYQLENTALKPLVAPLISIQLLDKDKKVISSHMDYWSNLKLAPSNTVNINTEFHSIKKPVGYVNIIFGNRLYFLIKKIISI